ncbi:GGDEF domain-containing protein [Paucilactobacillus suebicus]|uniref:Diguanylate cyclase phosphodiesterase domain-containing protein n=1 Tax=Paucilactobacillus suebicus DSM 5007 = KCTC 3549 TaxID=1423807 RepID=A0A0R1W0N2_9LACO|nr:GGDEF domain-containing protein [Paucilactobacillus suebicus]KRM09675.1 diguanylate cyclase phosphodiesterase domain-containing protein [Paucilactobacillus suebicus DSM 5007 = KCTC 3549]
MNFGTIALSYISSLIANAVVLLGGVSLYMWVEKEAENQFVVKHRNLILCSLGIALLLLAYMEAQSNNLMSSHLTGFHWTYLNLVIVALYNLILRLHIKTQLAITLIFTVLWGLSSILGHQISSITVEQTVRLMIVEVIVYIFAERIQSNKWLYLGAFLIFSAVALSMGSMLYSGQTSMAWVRQLVALAVLELVVYLYTRALRLQNEKMARFKHQAEYDGLTGVATFTVFNHDLQQLYNQFKGDGKAYAMYAMDVDHFKRINDTYGHVAGNEVLKSIAHQISEIVENSEFPGRLYRTGGEEFTVIVSDIQPDLTRAEKISRQIQNEVRKLKFDFKGQAIGVTISIGEDIAVESDANYLDLYKRADQFLYTSKHNGRNAITLRGETLSREVGLE